MGLCGWSQGRDSLAAPRVNGERAAQAVEGHGGCSRTGPAWQPLTLAGRSWPVQRGWGLRPAFDTAMLSTEREIPGSLLHNRPQLC